MNNIIKRIGEMRVKYAYATSLFNMFGMPVVVMKTIQDLLKNMGINIHFLALFIFIVLGLIVAGYVLDKIGLYEAEVTFQGKRNKELQYIKRGMKDGSKSS